MSSTELLANAKRYFEAGMLLVPVSGKIPQLKDWPNSKINSIEEFNRYVSNTTTGAAVLCGSPSQVYCLDVDPRNNGAESLQQFEKQHGQLPATVTSETGGGGLHFYYRHSEKIEKAQSLLPGIDFQGEKSLLIIPGSIHPSGATYRFKNGHGLGEVAIADLPPAILSILSAREKSVGVTVNAGKRNDTAFRYGCSLRAKGHSDEEVAVRVRQFILESCNPPLPNSEIEQIIDSCLRYNLGPYSVSNGSILKAGDPLSNFFLQIRAERRLDDGLAQAIQYLVGGQFNDGETIPDRWMQADEFYSGDFVKKLGSKAIVTVGLQNREHLKMAIKSISDDVKRELSFSHTGFRKVDGDLVFLHAKGAVGASGVDAEINTDLDGSQTRHIVLEDCTESDLLPGYCANVLELRDLGPRSVMIACIAFAFRAPTNFFSPVSFCFFLTGPTGTFKSVLLGLMMSFFGRKFDHQNLPGNFESTANAIEKMGFIFKDVIFGLDDFVPQGSIQDCQTKHKLLARIVRSVGNGSDSGRARMNADGSLRPTYFFRGSVAITGEDVVKGHSVRARLFIVSLAPGDIDPKNLSRFQEMAANGEFVLVMTSYIRWLCSNAKELEVSIPKRLIELRSKVVEALGHRRTPDIVASLFLGYELFLKFAISTNAIDRAEQMTLAKDGWSAILSLADLQKSYLSSEDPAVYFIDCLSAIFTSGRGHLANSMDHTKPPYPSEVWGWQYDTNAGDFKPKGNRIGWFNPENEEVMLDPDVAYASAQELARSQGNSIAVTKEILWKRLAERGLIARSDSEGKNLVKRKSDGTARKRVLVFHDSSIFSRAEFSKYESSGEAAPSPSVDGSRGI